MLQTCQVLAHLQQNSFLFHLLCSFDLIPAIKIHHPENRVDNAYSNEWFMNMNVESTNKLSAISKSGKIPQI